MSRRLTVASGDRGRIVMRIDPFSGGWGWWGKYINKYIYIRDTAAIYRYLLPPVCATATLGGNPQMSSPPKNVLWRFERFGGRMSSV